MHSLTPIDLTHALRPDMPVLPGDPPPEFIQRLSLDTDECAVQTLSFNNHLGTHLDAPAHFIAGGATVDQIPLQVLIGEAVVLDVTDISNRGRISRNDLAGRLPEQSFPSRLLLRTGWDSRFSSAEYFRNFPTLTLDAAELLAENGLRLLGMDTPSPSPLDDPGQAIHKTLLGAGTVLLESAANLDRITAPTCQLMVLPLPFQGCSGSPCRAVALV
jgi:kynurenine formamidase